MYPNLATSLVSFHDEKILIELERVGLLPIATKPYGECNTRVSSLLGPNPLMGPSLEFTRACRYWVVKGKVPIAVAEELYKTPVGKTDIRAGGDCWCVDPKTQANWYCNVTGKQVLKTLELKEAELYATMKGELGKIGRKILMDHEFSDDPSTGDTQGFVELYHIDSELGLYMFVQKMKESGL
jgi:hypothetical protein